MEPKNLKPEAQSSFPGGWIGAVICIVGIVALLAWASHQSGKQGPVHIPYSTFLGQVEAGNVSRVQISGNQITGGLSQPSVWPEPTNTAAAGANVPATGPSGSAIPASQMTYTAFATAYPEGIGDSGLISLLNAHHVEIDVLAPSITAASFPLVSILPLVAVIGLAIWMGRRAQPAARPMTGFGRSRARQYVATDKPVTFKQVAGADEAKADLAEVVDFLRHPDKYHDLGARIPRGILLVGPPGTGKTLLARAVAGEAGVPFLHISASEFVELYVGVGASRVRDLFEQARAQAPTIVFIDELDAVGRRRGAGFASGNDEREQTLNQLLVEMDGFDDRREVVVLAATNRADVLDQALLRPGRFDRQIVVGVPDRRAREAILGVHVKRLHLAKDVDVAVLARSTTGLSGAELANLCNEAALMAARHDHKAVTMRDFEKALDKIRLGAELPGLTDAQERRVVAYHEAGHALVAWLTPSADPVHKVTIIPHGQALGLTEQLPQNDRYNYGRDYLLGRLAVLLGGRVAEELALEDITTGAEKDLVEATRLARRMVARWAMGSLDSVAFAGDDALSSQPYDTESSRGYSEATAARIDDEVQRLMEERHEVVRRLLGRSRRQLDELVQALLNEETLSQEDIAAILGDRPEQSVHAPAPKTTPSIAGRRPSLLAGGSAAMTSTSSATGE